MIVRFFTWKRLKKNYDAKLIFWSFATFFVLTIFWSGAKQRFCFRESMSVLDQNGRIQALGFLARWQLTSHALYYKIPYLAKHFPHSLHIWFFLPSWTSTICLLNLLLLKNVLPHSWQLGFSLLWIMTCLSNSSLFSKFSWSQFGQLKVKKDD